MASNTRNEQEHCAAKWQSKETMVTVMHFYFVVFVSFTIFRRSFSYLFVFIYLSRILLFSEV